MESGLLKHNSPAVSQSAQQQIIQEIQEQEWWGGTALGEKKRWTFKIYQDWEWGCAFVNQGLYHIQDTTFYLYFTIPSLSSDLNQAVG